VQPKRSHLKLAHAIMAIDHQMAMIQVQVRKNFTDDVVIDGRFGVNIIVENLRVQLGLLKFNPTLIICGWQIKP